MDTTDIGPLETADRVEDGVCVDCEDPERPIAEDGYCQPCWDKMAEDWLEQRREFARARGWSV